MKHIAEIIDNIYTGKIPPPSVQQLVGFDFVSKTEGQAVFFAGGAPGKAS